MGSKGKSTSSSKVKETALSKEQANILATREAYFRDKVLPELKEYANETSALHTSRTYDTFAETDKQVRDGALQSESSNLRQQLKQQGLGTKDGLNALNLMQKNAEGTKLNQSRLNEILSKNNASLQDAQGRGDAINLLTSLAPQSTTALNMASTTQRTTRTSGLGGQALAGALGSAVGAWANRRGDSPYAGKAPNDRAFDLADARQMPVGGIMNRGVV